MELSDDLKALFDEDTDGFFDAPKKATAPTADDRLTTSFNEITNFVELHGNVPDADSVDIAEASLAKRLEFIRNNPDKVASLKPVDALGLLNQPEPPSSIDELFEKDDFGLFDGTATEILEIKNIPAKQLRSPVEPKAQRKRAKDFDSYKEDFVSKQNGLARRELKLTRYVSVKQLAVGRFYIQDGMMLKIVDAGEKKRVYDRNKERFRVIFENGTESNMYRRSLSARLYENGFAVVPATYSGEYPTLDSDDLIKGYIYVLASKSDDPKITTIRNLFKIGFTTTPIADRIKDAVMDPTYLMADVDLVDSYILTGEYNPQKVEHFLHRIFAATALNITIVDKTGHDYHPKEWYCVPLPIIEQAVNLLQSGDITDYAYDSTTERMALVNRGQTTS
jgi:hypothetical protein